MKKFYVYTFTMIAILTLTNCNKIEDESLDNFLYEGISMVSTNSSDFEFISNDKDGNMVLYDWESNFVKKVICREKNGNWAAMYFNEHGYPNYFYSKDYIVIIKNLTNKKADFAVIDLNSNDINIFREVDFDLGELNLNKIQNNLTGQKKNFGWYGDVAQGLKMASISLTTFTLVTAYIGVAPGPHSPVALALSGTSLVLSIISEIASIHFEKLEASSLAFSIGGDAIGCSSRNGLSCVGLGSTIIAEVLEIIEDNQNKISVVEIEFENILSEKFKGNTLNINIWEIYNTTSFIESGLSLKINDTLIINRGASNNNNGFYGIISKNQYSNVNEASVDVWMSSLHNWQDHKATFHTPIGAMGYYNYGAYWYANYVNSSGVSQTIKFANNYIPNSKYTLRIRVSTDKLIFEWNKGEGFVEVYSTADFSTELYKGQWPNIEKKVLLSTQDRGYTKYDNLILK